MNALKTDRVRAATVELVLDLRAEYLATGANALPHWDQLLDRMRASARSTSSVVSWITAVSRGLGLGAPSERRGQSTVALVEAVGPDDAAFLDLVENEHAYLLALARRAARERREERAARRAAEGADDGPSEG